MSNENMAFYQQFRECPKEAQKPIAAGRLKGMTDINPVWRIKILTEVFGPVGIGWVCPVVERWVEESPETKERVANVRVQLRYKHNGEWSEPIDGIGGAMLVAQESKGIHADDEAFKKAYTDAISVACKSLGIAADIYFARDPDTKYSAAQPTEYKKAEKPRMIFNPNMGAAGYRNMLLIELEHRGIDAKAYGAEKGLNKDTTAERYFELIWELMGCA